MSVTTTFIMKNMQVLIGYSIYAGGHNVFTTSVDAVAYENLHVFHKEGGRYKHNIAEVGADEHWSYIVWYMDKNRPLPSGTAFDAYRQRDYERRKAAGFPKPLYPSDIETPEATPEQQKERRRIGGW